MRSVLIALVLLAGAAPSAEAAISYVNRNSASTTTATLSITKPTGTTAGDVLVATVSGAGTAAISAPADWVALASTASPGATMRTQSFYRVATAAEGASYAFTATAARNMTGGIIALRGVSTALPVDAVEAASGASGNVLAPSVTTTAANAWVVTAASAARNTTFTPASGTTERYDRAGTSTSNNAATSTQSAAGATPARTVVPATATANWIAHTIALRDAAQDGLSVSSSGSPAFAASLDGGDAVAAFSVPATVLDTRPVAAGWRLQITATPFTTGTATLPSGATQVASVSGAACHGGAPCVLPVADVALPVTVPAAATPPAAVSFHNATSDTGAGAVDLSVGFAVTVPQSAFAGTYSATFTLSVVSGP